MFNRGSGVIGKLKRSLDFMTVRNNLISSNVANVDTPGYKAKAINFESKLRRFTKGNEELNLISTNDRHFGSAKMDIKADIVFAESGEVRVDGNNVDVDKEMAKLAENQIMFNSAVQTIAKKINGIKYAIAEGRRG